ncbi:hypothetical protein FACS189465_3030 [Clostridia bacterium]|nr:hypothetical protein FACS189465_3030 [Clostridia bacterium]
MLALELLEEEIRLEKELIRAVCDARESEGFAQKELEEKSGLTQSAIARMEKAVASPQVGTLIKYLRPIGYRVSITKDPDFVSGTLRNNHEQAKNTASFPAYSALAN